MLPTQRGAFRLFRLAGIDVFVHWSWFVVAVYEIQERRRDYRSFAWNAAEYLALFGIVTLHEFGHSLACRQVGGKAEQIVLWPLGGVAYVKPPQRPGATLWSLVAGPLTNAFLLPILFGLVLLAHRFGLEAMAPDALRWLRAIAFINLMLLVFNLLPIYPLDGGQILRSLLWFVLGRARSLSVAAALGLVGVAGLGLLALLGQSPWLGILAAFAAWNCWRGLQQARMLLRIAKLPRRAGLICPTCRVAPPVGLLAACGRCQRRFDVFEAHAVCPGCGAELPGGCVDCGSVHPIAEWVQAAEFGGPPRSPAD
jgi:Zn-dependent protease